jgi:hypothetical protein
MAVFWDVAPCNLIEVHRLWEVVAASIIRAMKDAGSISATSVDFYQITRCNIPEDSHLQTEN